ncbi:helix-turn-helix transcriptional regulator [Leptobacterium sp. I13]|uniref:S24 family peptidase n=1 Tax=Leptobacterium meishanense TaxID=3128904 RepID=UPI0030EF3336
MVKKVSNIKERIRKIAENTGLTKEVFFRKIGATSANFRGKKLETGVNSELIEKIVSLYPNINLHWLLTGVGDMEQQTLNEPSETYLNSYINPIPLIPIDAVAGLGNGEIQIQQEDIIDNYIIPEFHRKGVEYIIRVGGNSMSPTYDSGNLIGCKTINDRSFFQWGRVYVLDTDQGVMVKRLFPVKDRDDVVECRSDNKENYPPFIINKDSIYKIAIVVGALKIE